MSVSHIEAAFSYTKSHSWYMEARLITLYDDYSFDRTAPPSIDPFIGRHFRQPLEGLGFDNSPVKPPNANSSIFSYRNDTFRPIDRRGRNLDGFLET